MERPILGIWHLPVQAICGAFLLSVAPTAHAATLKSIASKENKTIISLTGEIVEGDAEAVRQAIQSANGTGKLVSAIRLNSPGGLLVEAVKLADIVRFAKAATSVPNGATCASACFIIFAAGSEKFSSYTSQIGVHGASSEGSRESAGAATVTMAKIVKELGVPASIIGKMVVTPPDQMVWLTPDELRSMGSTMTGKPMQVAVPPVTADSAPMPLLPDARAGMPAQTRPPVPSQTESPEQGRKKSWSEMVKYASELSAAQNHGRVNLSRVCQPEQKVCNTGIWYKYKGSDWLLKRTEDINGKTVSRELCTFNETSDVRTCFEFDSSKVHRDMKNARGDWIAVESE